LLDQEDLSRKIRLDLDIDSRLQLIENFFPNHRESFLGIVNPSPWQTEERFFTGLEREQPFTHRWTLVGRSETINEFGEFLTGGSQVAIVNGRGGIGKSRLLSEFSRKADEAGFAVRFLGVGLQPEPKDFELLRDLSPLLVVIDDVQDREHVSAVLQGVLAQRRDTKFILATRPHNRAELNHQLGRASCGGSYVKEWILSDLSVKEAEALAREALPEGAPEYLVKRLAVVSRDCPLITVLAAHLLRSGEFDVNRLEASEDIKAEVLRRYADGIYGNASKEDKEMNTQLLRAVALLQPVRFKQPQYQEALSLLTGAEFVPTIRNLLEKFENSGVLLRRGEAFRIVPDLLGDIVLQDACYDSFLEAPTEWTRRSLQLEGEPLVHAFKNACKADWILTRSGKESQASAELWTWLLSEFESGGILRRLQLITTVTQIASYAPERALEVVDLAVAKPTDIVDSDPGLQRGFGEITYDSVLRDLSPLLRRIGYTLKLLPAVVQRLWALSQVDERQLNPTPEHPIRILQSFASYEYAKPVTYNKVVLEAMERFLNDEVSSRYSVFDVIRETFSTEGLDDGMEGHLFVMRPFAIDTSKVAELRSEATRLALSEIKSGDPGRGVRAIEFLKCGLAYPTGMCGRHVSDEERDSWTPEILKVLAAFKDVVRDQDIDPCIHYAIRRALSWHANYSVTTTKMVAREILALIPRNTRQDLTRALVDPWSHVALELVDDYEKRGRLQKEWLNSVVTELIVGRSENEIVDLLEERLTVLEKTSFGLDSAGQLIWQVTSSRPEMAGPVVERAGTDSSSPWTRLLPVVLGSQAIENLKSMLDTCEKLLSDHPLEFVRNVAIALGPMRDRRPLSDEELPILKKLLAHHDEGVRCGAIAAVQRGILDGQYSYSVELLEHLRIENSRSVCDAFFQLFGRHSSFDWNLIPKTIRQEAAQALLESPTIQNYDVIDFLEKMAVVDPQGFVDFFKKRIELYESKTLRDRYEPLPIYGIRCDLTNDVHYIAILRDLIDWMSLGSVSWQKHSVGAELFVLICGGWNDQVLALFLQTIQQGSLAHIGSVAELLSKSYGGFVWDQEDFVIKALKVAASHGDQEAELIAQGLRASVISAMRSGVSGKPFPQDIEQRDRSAAKVKQLEPGTREAVFL